MSLPPWIRFLGLPKAYEPMILVGRLVGFKDEASLKIDFHYSYQCDNSLTLSLRS